MSDCFFGNRNGLLCGFRYLHSGSSNEPFALVARTLNLLNFSGGGHGGFGGGHGGFGGHGGGWGGPGGHGGWGGHGWGPSPGGPGPGGPPLLPWFYFLPCCWPCCCLTVCCGFPPLFGPPPPPGGPPPSPSGATVYTPVATAEEIDRSATPEPVVATAEPVAEGTADKNPF